MGFGKEFWRWVVSCTLVAAELCTGLLEYSDCTVRNLLDSWWSNFKDIALEILSKQQWFLAFPDTLSPWGVVSRVGEVSKLVLHQQLVFSGQVGPEVCQETHLWHKFVLGFCWRSVHQMVLFSCWKGCGRHCFVPVPCSYPIRTRLNRNYQPKRTLEAIETVKWSDLSFFSNTRSERAWPRESLSHWIWTLVRLSLWLKRMCLELRSKRAPFSGCKLNREGFDQLSTSSICLVQVGLLRTHYFRLHCRVSLHFSWRLNFRKWLWIRTHIHRRSGYFCAVWMWMTQTAGSAFRLRSCVFVVLPVLESERNRREAKQSYKADQCWQNQ